MAKAVYKKSTNIRVSNAIIKWLTQLAKEAERTPSALVRDLIFYLRFSDAGPIICRHISDEGIRYHSDEPASRRLAIRVDDDFLKWLEQLAEQANRTPSAFLKDLIWYMRMSPSGPILCKQLVDQRIRYRPFRSPVIPPAMVRPVFPWDHNLPEQSEG